VHVVQGRLRVGVSNLAVKLDEAISQSLNGAATDSTTYPKPILIEIAGSSRRLAVYLLPIFQPILAERFLTHTRVIVLVIEQKLDEPADPAIVRDLLGMTLGEAKIAAMIGAGLSPKDTATKLGIKEDTARTVLKKVFSKTGVSRQGELGQRFLGSNHIRRPRRVCRTKCV
jgi:DNA-binding CsgD family transcriptional regulator